MKTTFKFDLSEQMKQISKAASKLSDELKESINEAINKASDAMLEEAKKNTPHIGDGKVRGKNMITNELYSSWRVIKTTDNGFINGISLVNDKDYAQFIQYGHRVTRHFVPWLYFDGDLISRSLSHGKKLFGIVVGTKTKHVDGIDMTGPAEKKFEEVFNKEAGEVLNNIDIFGKG